MRTHTLIKEGSPYFPPTSEIYKVGDVPFEAVLEKRIQFIQEEVPLLATTDYPEWLSGPLYNSWPGHLQEFQAQIFGTEEVIANMSWFGSNRRAQMQVAQFSYLDFINRHQGYGYRLIETIMRCGWRFPPVHYKYSATKKINKFERHMVEEMRADTRFLPSAFSVPRLPIPVTTERGHSQSLLGLRVLQLVRAHSLLVRERSDVVELLTIEGLGQICKGLFGYDPVAVGELVEEYEEFEILRTQGRVAVDAPKNDRHDIIALPKLDYLLNRAICDLAYLNLASMRLVLNETAFVDEERMPFIRATFYGPKPGSKVNDWVLCKITNAAALVRIIARVNEQQRSAFNRNLSVLKPHYATVAIRARSDGMFECVRFIREGVLRDIRSMIGTPAAADVSVSRLELGEILSGLRNYVREWQRPA